MLFRSYATIVGEKAVLRRLIKTTEEIANTCYAGKEPLENILADTEKSVFNLLQNRGGQDFVPIKQVAINVQNRYAEYMRRMSDKTQFLVITHRRGTMEEADMLYGCLLYTSCSRPAGCGLCAVRPD